MKKYSQQDVQDLATEIRRAQEREKPFVFVTGAGVSKEADIPLAGEIIADISTRYANRIRGLQVEEHLRYGAYMAKLTTNERRDYLKDILAKSKINWANLALAAMLKAGYIYRVMTFNFDNVLTRACGLMGHYPALYDFGGMPSSNLDHIVNGSIVHLHGQSYGLVMLNTTEEVNKHTAKIEPLIKQSLDNHPICIIGYSGEADSQFSLFENHYRCQEQLYWLSYSPNTPQHLNKLLLQDNAKWLGGVDADVFLIELAKELKCWPPQCFSDPPAHLLAEFTDVQPYPDHFVGHTDYLSDTQAELTDWSGRRRPRHLQELLIGGDYEEVIATAAEGNDNHKSVLASAYFQRAYDLQDQAERTKNTGTYQKAADAYEKAASLRKEFHEALYNWANALSDLAKIKQDKALFQHVFAKYNAALESNPDDHATLGNWGNALLRLYAFDRKPEYLDEAEPMLLRAEELSGKPSYNVACLQARRGNEKACHEKLLACKDAGTLEDAAHLMADDDLAAYRDRDWFKALLT